MVSFVCPGSLRLRIVAMLAILVLANIAAWCAAYSVHSIYRHFLWIAWLAYGFGLRHAVDADHICAIDNTTRKLMQDGKRPVAVGLFFSLGHSTVVVLLCALASIAGGYARAHLPLWQDLGGRVGSGISTAFLYVIAAINLSALVSLSKAYRSGVGDALHQSTDTLVSQLGMMGRIFRPVLRAVTNSWQMYFVGLLFGLGFDTATEVGMLALAAQQSASGLSLGALMLLPGLFTLGMTLIDSINGLMMLGAYGWAYLNPARKLYYNLAIVITSIGLALVVATGQLLDLLGMSLRLGPLLTDNLGFVIVGIFLVGWSVSILIDRVRYGRDVDPVAAGSFGAIE